MVKLVDENYALEHIGEPLELFGAINHPDECGQTWWWRWYVPVSNGNLHVLWCHGGQAHKNVQEWNGWSYMLTDRMNGSVSHRDIPTTQKNLTQHACIEGMLRDYPGLASRMPKPPEPPEDPFTKELRDWAAGISSPPE